MSVQPMKLFGLRVEVFLTAEEAVAAGRRILQRSPEIPALTVVHRIGLQWEVDLTATRLMLGMRKETDDAE